MELLAAHTELTKSHTAKHQKAVDMLKEVDAALYTKDHQDIPGAGHEGRQYPVGSRAWRGLVHHAIG